MAGGLSTSLALAVVGMTVLSASVQPAPGPVTVNGSLWEIETATRYAKGSSLALDSKDNPHIGFNHGTSISLKYATLTDTGWVSEFVDSRKYGGHGGSPSIAVDRNDHPHISYDLHPPHGPLPDHDLRYAWWDGSGWNVQIVDTDGSVGKYSSIALTSTEYPHIAYTRDYYGLGGVVAGDLKYARWNGTGWNIEIIEHASGYVRLSQRSLAIDSHDTLHISYSAQIGEEYYIKYARWNGGAWEITVVDLVGEESGSNSLALDSFGNPHISYYDRTNGSLKYARWNGGPWQIEVVTSAGEVGDVNSLVLDSEDSPHIAYADWGDYDLKYASRNCNAWRTEIVDSAGFAYYIMSLALNRSDYPHAIYVDFMSFDLKYAYRTVKDQPSCDVSLDVDPDTLDLKSRGRWITAYLSSENASVSDVDVTSIRLQDTLLPERWDYQDDVLMLKFNRHALIAILEVGESVEIKLSGKWEDGTAFEAYDHIRVISPGRWVGFPWFSRTNPSFTS